MDTFIPKSFDELIGSKPVLLEWKRTIETIEKGQIVFISGFSGVGKTLGTKLLIEECGYNSLFLDTSVSTDGKDVLDRIQKFDNWSDMSTSFQQLMTNTSKKVIVIDEIESFIKLDRNILNCVLSYTKANKDLHVPIIIISHVDVLKKLGDMKNYITTHIKINRLEDVDIFLFFKTRIPKNKIRLNELMKIVEQSNGNIYSSMLSILNRLLQKNSKHSPLYYVAEEQKTLQELFECKNPTIVEKLLADDDWMNPLKVHENIIKILNREIYVDFLKKYLYYEMWHSKLDEYSMTDIHMMYLTHIILEAVRNQKTDGKIDTMDFSKLLSYISTKKKYKKLMYQKLPLSYPVEDLGLFWIHSHIYNKKNEKIIL
jgi:hypothetical protein